MADFNQSELLNEVSRIFRSRLDPGREGGTLNTEEEYIQLLDIASITFLLNNDSVFYLARIAANALNSTRRKEVSILEDLLVGLEQLSNIGEPVRDVSTLNNAKTTLLDLDAAASLAGRPETARFDKLMGDYAEKLRGNVVLARSNELTRPREDARNTVKSNLAKLSPVHARLLDGINGSRDLLTVFNDLDIPAKAAADAFRNVRVSLERVIERNETLSDADNIAVSRQSLLTTLASQVSVRVIAEFSDPGELKYRSPVKPIPSNLEHTGQATGEGDAAFVRTNGGPWQFPISEPLVVSVDGGAPQTVELDKLAGSVMNGVNSEGFPINFPAAGHSDLYVSTDPTVFNLTVSSAPTPGVGSPQTVTCNEPVVLGFKHLGAYVFHPDYNISVASDSRARAIVEMRELQSFISGFVYSSTTGFLTATGGLSAIEDTASGFRAEHVGAYIHDAAGIRFEITEYISPTVVVIDARGLTPVSGPPARLRGQVVGIGTTKFEVRPRWSGGVGGGERMDVGPSLKAWRCVTGKSHALSFILSDMASPAAAQPFAANHTGASLFEHVKPQPVAGGDNQLALAVRSRLNPFLQLSTSYLVVDTSDPPGAPVHEQLSADVIFGLDPGEVLESEFDTNDLLSPSELVGVITDGIDGAVASVVATQIAAGDSLSASFGTKFIQDDSANFVTAGVKVGDIAIVEGGDAAGTYQVAAVTTSTVLSVFRTETFVRTETGLAYEIIRNQVQMTSASTGVASSIEVVSGPAEMGFPSGPQYGTIPQFEAVDKLGSKLEFSRAAPGDLLRVVGITDLFEVESVEGELLRLTSGLPSNLVNASFEIQSASALSYNELSENLTTYTSSANLLKKHKLDQGLELLEAAVTAAILPGRNFASSRNQALRIVGDLLSILTADPPRADEYSFEVPTASANLEDILGEFHAEVVPAVSKVIDSFAERKYDRAVDFIKTGKLDEFYGTTQETGSYAGFMMVASRAVLSDLPQKSTQVLDVDREGDLAVSSWEVPDAEHEFDDVDDVFETDIDD
jgi:hypothetical protein